MKKNIILLSAKRTGSTAVMKIFQKHKRVKLLHIDQKIPNWESNFWSLAVEALNGTKENFENRLKISAPFIIFPDSYSKNKIFEIFNELSNFFGPVTFDKSPQYLGNYKCLELIQEYNSIYNNIIFIGLIRNPLDAIISQYQLWSDYKNNDSLEDRESRWLIKYNHLLEIKKKKDLMIIRYEELVNRPHQISKKILDYCNLKFDDDCIKHLKKISVGRYQAFKSLKSFRWKWSREFNQHLKNFDYHPKSQKKISIYKKFKIIILSFKRFIPKKFKNLLRIKLKK